MSLHKMTIRLDEETHRMVGFGAKASWRTVSGYIAHAVREQIKRDTIASSSMDKGMAIKFARFLKDNRTPSGSGAVAAILSAMTDAGLWDGDANKT